MLSVVSGGRRKKKKKSPGFGAFSSSPYTVPLCWVWGPGIAVLWSCQRVLRCVTVFACFSSSSSRRTMAGLRFALLMLAWGTAARGAEVGDAESARPECSSMIAFGGRRGPHRSGSRCRGRPIERHEAGREGCLWPNAASQGRPPDGSGG